MRGWGANAFKLDVGGRSRKGDDDVRVDPTIGNPYGEFDANNETESRTEAGSCNVCTPMQVLVGETFTWRIRAGDTMATTLDIATCGLGSNRPRGRFNGRPSSSRKGATMRSGEIERSLLLEGSCGRARANTSSRGSAAALCVTSLPAEVEEVSSDPDAPISSKAAFTLSAQASTNPSSFPKAGLAGEGGGATTVERALADDGGGATTEVTIGRTRNGDALATNNGTVGAFETCWNALTGDGDCIRACIGRDTTAPETCELWGSTQALAGDGDWCRTQVETGEGQRGFGAEIRAVANPFTLRGPIQSLTGDGGR